MISRIVWLRVPKKREIRARFDKEEIKIESRFVREMRRTHAQKVADPLLLILAPSKGRRSPYASGFF
jgi:hypothetical protein